MAGRFFRDAQWELGMSDLVLGMFLEEMYSTLTADMRLLARQKGVSAGTLASLSDVELQSYLNGHPKLLLNKGRMGFGASDSARYAPESGSPFRLVWVAVREALATVGGSPGFDRGEVLSEAMDESERTRLEATFASLCAERKLAPDAYLFLPVHPWQWDRIVQIQFAAEIAAGDLLWLGEFGDAYRPQTSVRTLTNFSRPGRADLKLPLSVLNTSAIRGLSRRHLENAPPLSRAMARLCREDRLLRACETTVLEEFAAIGFGHRLYSEVPGAPYRYHEQLGAIWRKPPACASGETATLTAALFHRDFEGRSLIGEWIKRSGIGTVEWLRRYFNSVFVPLYHLQLHYGIGLVAHGQNIVLRLRDHAPAGIWTKDFQGDLRLAEGNFPRRHEFLAEFEGRLDSLPPEHLIHDLATGHLLTVLRFVSATLWECSGFPEARFYALLRESITAYLKEYPPEAPLVGDQDLLRATLNRVLVNKVRFQIGYGDSADRPRPLVGRPLQNPLSQPEATYA